MELFKMPNHIDAINTDERTVDTLEFAFFMAVLVVLHKINVISKHHSVRTPVTLPDKAVMFSMNMVI